MTDAGQVSFVDSVFHPTDLTPGSETAFAHALVVALIQRTRFVIFHAGHSAEETWDRLPQVRETLVRWGLLEPGSPRSAVMDQLSLRVSKVHGKGNPLTACFKEIRRQQPELLVLATEGREGLQRWLKTSVAEGIARRSTTSTLFVPKQGRGFVNPEDGSLTLRRILVPVDARPDPTAAIVRATRAAAAIGDPPVEITLLSVNADPAKPALEETEDYRFGLDRRDGDVVQSIVEAAEDADLIVMATEGRDGVLDALRGSVTERVVRAAPCPVLAVPVLED